MKRLVFSIIAAIVSLTISAQTIDEVKDAIRNVNNAWQKNHPAPEYGGTKAGLSAFWDNAVYHTGNMEAYDLLKEQAWLDYSLAWAERNNWQGASEKDASKWKYKRYGEGQDFVLFGDWQICFQTYIDLYNFTGKKDEKMVARAKEVMGYEAHSDKDDYWWWADALYMVMPVMTKMYNLTGDKAYLDKMYANWKYANDIMYDKQTGLYFRDGKYVFPKHTTAAGKKDFWARGDGWVMAAFAKILKDMPKNYKHRKEFIKYYRKLAGACIASQQLPGYWTRSMLDPDQAPGCETSGTALMCYSLFWGINNGYLPKSYVQMAFNSWRYLYTVALQPDYTIGYVQPIGEKAIPGQVVDKNSTSNFGTGAFLLAASEVCRFMMMPSNDWKNY
ncbi:MAG: glycoside hydrolase family 88 protein [Prevotella sp.]|nr:glycoside hydrolase family 88 protein [Candidatus Prevotella equi]